MEQKLCRQQNQPDCVCIFIINVLHWDMFPYVALQSDKKWQPGPYPGVELMVLHKNEQTGGVTVLRKFAAGMTIPAHIHPQANETAYVLSGQWEESGVIYSHRRVLFRSQRRTARTARCQNRSDQLDGIRWTVDRGLIWFWPPIFKFQIPTSKLQRSFKSQYPKLGRRIVSVLLSFSHD